MFMVAWSRRGLIDDNDNRVSHPVNHGCKRESRTCYAPHIRAAAGRPLSSSANRGPFEWVCEPSHVITAWLLSMARGQQTWRAKCMIIDQSSHAALDCHG